MKPLTLILRGARFYWRTHLGVVLGAALATMVLTGSLLTGDAVKATLRRQAELRVGHVRSTIVSNEHFFRSNISEDAAPILMIQGSVARVDGSARVNRVQIIGVDKRFWKYSPAREYVYVPEQGVGFNDRLTRALNAKEGESFVIRVEKPGSISKDAPLSGEASDLVSFRATAGPPVGEEGFGRFALSASQVPPYTVFMRLEYLQEKLGLFRRANVLLDWDTTASQRTDWKAVKSDIVRESFRSGHLLHAIQMMLPGGVVVTSSSGSPTEFEAKWTLEDFDLRWETLQSGGLELRTPRVFLDPPVVGAAPRGKDDRRVDALTYFVNELRAGEKATPYSMVTAVETASSGFLPAELADGEMVISQWLADDLGIGAGGEVTVKYFVMGERRELVEQARKFTVLAVLPMDEPQLNTSWMPDFPGLSDKANCRDWKPGFDFDATRMRDKDQAYWTQYRGTPKAFVNLKVGQEMWGNRWGAVTAMRWPAGTERAEIERELRGKLTPEQLGFQFIPLRAQALAATDAPVDFGELFVYFSFFLIAAAAVLTGMLFTFSLEQRNAEAGLLLALGLRAKQVRRLFLAEGAVLAIAGGVLGIYGAVLYTKLVLRALATVWRGAVGTTDFVLTVKPGTLVMGVVSGVAVAVLAMWWASRRQLRRSARELLVGEVGEEEGKGERRKTKGEEGCHPERSGGGKVGVAESKDPGGSITRSTSADRRGPSTALHSAQDDGREFFPLRVTPWWREALAGVCVLAAVGMVFSTTDAGAFFGAGALLLIAGLLLSVAMLRRAAVGTDLESVAQLGVRNAARRRGRSVGIIGVLASGVFMVVAVDAFRQRPAAETARRDTGTGGFALVGESALPIYDDLNTAKGREAFALDEKVMEGVSVVPLRVRDGDDASCLNLNRALQPRVLGVKAEELAARGAFRFAAQDSGSPNFREWRQLLETRRDGDHIGAIADENTVRWAMQKKLGDTVDYRDERGHPFQVRIVATVAGSIFQGNVIIDERRFVEKFPGNGGYRFFLIDCPREKIAAVREHLSRQLADRGLELTPAGQRLAEFQAVENTYLSIFQALGGLGLLLGSAGLAITVARNVLERRAEFGLLEAVGFRRWQLRALVFAEHRWLIVCGLVIGTASAVVAVWPGLRERAGGFPLAEMGVLLGALAVGCVFWAWVATRVALRGSGVAALRSE